MTDVTIYHNPRCSKSRQTLELLKARDVEPRIIKYLDTPPGPEELKTILDRLGMKPRDLMRKKEKEYKALGLDDETLTNAQLIQAMVEHPRLIERPIVLKSDKAALGRPPEQVLDIL